MDDLRSAAAAQEHSQSARDGPPLLDQDQAGMQAAHAEGLAVALFCHGTRPGHVRVRIYL